MGFQTAVCTFAAIFMSIPALTSAGLVYSPSPVHVEQKSRGLSVHASVMSRLTPEVSGVVMNPVNEKKPWHSKKPKSTKKPKQNKKPNKGKGPFKNSNSVISHVSFLYKGKNGRPKYGGRINRGEFREFMLFGTEDYDFRAHFKRRIRGVVRFYSAVGNTFKRKNYLLVRQTWKQPYCFGTFTKGRGKYWLNGRLNTLMFLKVTAESDTFLFSANVRIR